MSSETNPMQAAESASILKSEILIDAEFNCRGIIAPMDVIQLANDIEKNGLMQPVTVMEFNEEEREATGKKYCLIAGFRRTAAFDVKKWDSIPCVVKPWMAESRRKILNLAENVQREDLNILQEAKALEHLKSMGIARETVAQELGKSGKWVQIRYYLLELPEQIQKEAEAGLINQHQIMSLRKMKNEDEQFEAVRLIKTAKEKGQAAPEIDKKKIPSKGAKTHRSRTLIQQRMNELTDLRITPGFWSVCLAWASGEISDTALFAAANKHCQAEGIDSFRIPAKYLPDA